MTARCHRCDWAADDQAALLEHAQEFDHPLCVVCQSRSLYGDEPQCCRRCLARARADLGDVGELYAHLSLTLALRTALPTDTGADKLRAGGDEHPLPGGDLLVLLAGGTTGSVTSTRRGNREHAADAHPDDPPSVLAVLAGWEDDVRAELGHPPAGPAYVTSAQGYLVEHLDWLAQHHPAFAELAADLRRLRSTLVAASGLAERPLKAPVGCLDCGGDLERGYGPLGLVDDWSCRGCGRAYTQAAYVLALRASLDGSPDALLDAATAARRHGVTAATVRQWAVRGRLRRRGSDSQGRTLFRSGDVAELATRRDEAKFA